MLTSTGRRMVSPSGRSLRREAITVRAWVATPSIAVEEARVSSDWRYCL